MIDGKGNKNSSLPFSFSKIYMTKKSKNVGKTIGLIFLGLAIIGALAGSGVAISRYVSKKLIPPLKRLQTIPEPNNLEHLKEADLPTTAHPHLVLITILPVATIPHPKPRTQETANIKLLLRQP